MSTLDKPKSQKKRRSRGDGGIYEYRPGRFRAYIDIGFKEDGTRLRKSFIDTSRTELIKKMNEYKAQQQRGALVADAKDTLNDYMTRWLDLKKTQVRATTIEGYEYIYNFHMKNTIGKHKLQKITPAVLNDYLNKKLTGSEEYKPLSGTSVKKHKALLHSVFKTALHEGLLYSNPVERTTVIKADKPDVKALSTQEAQQLLKVARDLHVYYKKEEHKKWQLYQIYHIVYLALTTGLRRGELIGLKWNCIDEKANTLSVREAIVEVKGGSRVDQLKTVSSKRTIALEPSVIKTLKEIRVPIYDALGVDKREDYIFHTETGKALIPSNVNRAFTILLQKAKMSCRFHDLRHTHATLLISNGLDIKTVSERLGHSDIVTTLNKYTHVVDAVDQKAASTVVNLLKTTTNTNNDNKV